MLRSADVFEVLARRLVSHDREDDDHSYPKFFILHNKATCLDFGLNLPAGFCKPMQQDTNKLHLAGQDGPAKRPAESTQTDPPNQRRKPLRRTLQSLDQVIRE